MKNPLLEPKGLPVFNSIQASHVNDAVQRTLEKMRSKLVKAETSTTPSFQTAEEMERIQDSIHQVWGPISHLNSVISTPELREAYNKCLPMISEFGTELAQSEKLWAMFSQLEKDTDPSYTAKRQLISHTLRDFKLAGVGLPIESKNKFKELVKTLAQYQASFEQNLMDATDAFKHHETDKAALVGIPYMMLSRAKELAEKEGKIWLVILLLILPLTKQSWPMLSTKTSGPFITKHG